MTIKQHPNKSSVLKNKSRYVQGGLTDLKKKRLGWWEQYNISKNDVTDITVYIDVKYKSRPDLIAYEYYGDTSLTWVVLQYNNIVDVETELVVGSNITIPSKDRVYFNILTKTTRIQDIKL